MTIAEAMKAASDEYNQECHRMREDKAFAALCAEYMRGEYRQIDQELPGYVSDIMLSQGAPSGTILDFAFYQMARMCFRMGMRVQRKLDHPTEATSILWRSDQKVV